MNALTEYDTLATVLVKHVRDAFVDEPTIAAQWMALNYTAPPDLARASDEHDRFIDLLRSTGATVRLLPPDPRTTLDSIYVRDASIVSPAGLILCTMGKAARATEPAAQQQALELGVAICRPHHTSGTTRGRRPDLARRADGRRRPRISHERRRHPAASCARG